MRALTSRGLCVALRSVAFGEDLGARLLVTVRGQGLNALKTLGKKKKKSCTRRAKSHHYHKIRVKIEFFIANAALSDGVRGQEREVYSVFFEFVFVTLVPEILVSPWRSQLGLACHHLQLTKSHVRWIHVRKMVTGSFPSYPLVSTPPHTHLQQETPSFDFPSSSCF